MAQPTAGRHRAPGRPNPFTELSEVATRAGVTSAKTSAVLAASGGLVAALTLPASAGNRVEASALISSAQLDESQADKAQADKAHGEAGPSAAVTAAVAPAIVAPALIAPATVDATSVTSEGVFGVKAVPKPKPTPRPVVRTDAPDERRTPAPAEPTPTRQAPRAVAQSASGIVNIARGLLGIFYKWGGTTPDGFDCSGFTQYVYKQAGINIPRTASEQQRAITKVTDPKPGDLVFFGSPAWHVAVYTGPGMMIDSPRRGKTTSERKIFGTPWGYGRF